ncbi:MAG TPA: Sec-independent protein translocase protein TatB [Paracoccaceae bacterium]|nr:Sec-independent protein translocase protein TatB [Paracoccaceae bacterium]
MLDIGWSELLVIGVVALLVVGPKDLPKLFHTVGQYMNKARAMAREFQRNMEEAARDAGVDEVTKSVRDATNMARGGMPSLHQIGRDFARPMSAPKPAAPAAAVPPAAPSAPAPAPSAEPAEPAAPVPPDASRPA